MRRARIAGLALLTVFVASIALPIAARAALPAHIAARIEQAARESRELAQRDAALVQSLNAQHLAATFALRAHQSAVAGMNTVVVEEIAENPALAGDIVALAVAAAPGLRDSIVRRAAEAFPFLAAEIFAAAGGPPAPVAVTPFAPPPQPIYAAAPAPVSAAPFAPPPQPDYAAAPPPADVETGVGGPDERMRDPYEGVNRAIFAFNDTIDTYVLRPVAAGYRFIVPDVAKRLVRNFVQNLNGPVVLANDLLQGEGGDASVAVGRLVVNSTFGVFGLFDVADAYGLQPHHADFGQTLHSYDVGPGPYVMLPLLGPSTVRDGAGIAVDTLFNPLTYVASTPTNLAVTGGKAVVKRETLIDPLDDLRTTSVDYYAALRSAYYQDRAVELRKGVPADTTELDELFESAE